jgi:hypothetical protein
MAFNFFRDGSEPTRRRGPPRRLDALADPQEPPPRRQAPQGDQQPGAVPGVDLGHPVPRGGRPQQRVGLCGNRANYQLRDPATGTTRRIEKLNAGRVIDSSSKIKWEFPSVGVGLDKLVLALQADLRGAAARLVMPEYMFTSDASNNNVAIPVQASGLGVG